jgi:hypothetical protein
MSYVSKFMSLHPCNVITGMLAGVGLATQNYLKPGCRRSFWRRPWKTKTRSPDSVAEGNTQQGDET